MVGQNVTSLFSHPKIFQKNLKNNLQPLQFCIFQPNKVIDFDTLKLASVGVVVV